MTKKDLMRRWGLPESYQSQNLRYQAPLERGIYWYWFSLDIRQRDLRLYGVCISCGKPIEAGHAGHFIPTGECGWDGMVFNPRNVNLECAACNHRDKVKLEYARNLDRRYGAGTAQELREIYYKYKEGGHRNWKRVEYEEKIKELPAFKATLLQVADP